MKHQRHFDQAKELAKTMIKLDAIEVMKPVKNAVLNNYMRFNFPYFEIIDREFNRINLQEEKKERWLEYGLIKTFGEEHYLIIE